MITSPRQGMFTSTLIRIQALQTTQFYMLIARGSKGAKEIQRLRGWGMYRILRVILVLQKLLLYKRYAISIGRQEEKLRGQLHRKGEADSLPWLICILACSIRSPMWSSSC